MSCVPWYARGSEWMIRVENPDPADTLYYETIFSQANGYMGVRGYTEEPTQGFPSVREGYWAGIFSSVDDEASAIIGEFPWPVVQMVNLPEIFRVDIELDGETFSPTSGNVVHSELELDLRNALLTRCVVWKSPNGKTTELRFERFLSADTPNLACHRVSLMPLDWSGPAKLSFLLDGNVVTPFRCGDKRRPHLPEYHFYDHSCKLDGADASLEMATRHTEHRLAVASAIRVPRSETAGDSPRADMKGYADERASGFTQELRLQLQEGAGSGCERFVSLATERDDWLEPPGDSPSRHARPGLAEAAGRIAAGAAEAGFSESLSASAAVWSRRWADADVEIDGPPVDQKVARYNIFQLLQMAPYHTDRVSLPARAYAYNRYRGLYFWDTEIFILPFYCWTQPQVARNLLTFRHNTIEGARENARVWGGSGALYSWMGASETGRDNSIDARIWKLLHQVGDIAYAVDQYARISADERFMLDRGAEVVFETARFFASRLNRDEAGIPHLEQTIGPDEDGAPGRDNGYTLLIARRNLQLACEWFERLTAPDGGAGSRSLRGLASREELEKWRSLAADIRIPVIPDTDIPLQDEYFLSKKPADVQAWRLRDAPENWRLPEGVNLRDYQTIKQADIVLAAFLLSDEFSQAQITRAFDFYEPVTRHTSSLSWNTHAIVAARIGRPEQAYEYYLNSAGLDLDNIKDATADGLHAAALGGCWQAVVLGFAGLTIDDGTIRCRPALPEPWKSLRFHAYARGKRFRIEVRRDGSWECAEIEGPISG